MRIVFLGVGALGSTTAVLCRALDATFAFVDFDKVESKNLASQAFVKQSLGKNKAEALKAQLLNFYGLKAEAFGVRLTAENVAQLLDGASLAVDCFDNAQSRQLVSAHARAKGLPLVHAAISGDGSFGIIRWDAHFVPDAEDHAGQATCEGGEHLPMIGLLAATLARTIQDFVARQEQRDSMVGLKSVTVTS
jgi:molybdopterin/thiamine biosynthesis adenylyltransferase